MTLPTQGRSEPEGDSRANTGGSETTQPIEGADAAGERIGRYQLLQKIGEGGMGEVWLAEQKEPVRRRVAVKLVKSGMNSREVITRFESERQALALMDHPAIAKVLDAGSTAQGTPYFVMEYVAGVPITTYCDQHRLSTRERLELFIRTCEGVHHAHQKAIIHRDLKPSNILVSDVDGKAAPKIIDFGVAKALVPTLSAATMFTRAGALIGTPEYMSPEQARSSGEDIDTRTDIYSLGIIFYELLAGVPPIDLRQVAFDEFLRKLREEEPPKPSTRIRTQDAATSTDVARKRQSEPLTLAREIRGDLDSIALKALEKDRARRYGSAAEFGADVRLYLNNQPVMAVPASTFYRARKYVRRNWVGVTAAAITLAGVSAGAGVGIYQGRVARSRFEQVRKLAHSFVFDYHDQLASLTGTTHVREQMVTTALEYLDNLSHSAQRDVSLQKELASSYRKIGDVQGFPAKPNLGHEEEAIRSYRKAAAIYESILRREPAYRLELCEFYAAFAFLLVNSGKREEAGNIAGQSLQCSLDRSGARPNDRSAQGDLARAYMTLGDIDDQSDRDAYENYQKADQIAHQILNRWHDESALRLNDMTRSRFGSAAHVDGKLTEARQAYDEAGQIIAELVRLKPNNPEYRRGQLVDQEDQVRIVCNDTAPTFEDPEACLVQAREYHRMSQQVMALDPNDAAVKGTLAISLYQLSFGLMKNGDANAAVQAARQSLRMFDEILAEGKSYFAVSRRRRALVRLAEALLGAGQAQEAARAASELVAAERETAQSEAPELKVTDRLSVALMVSGQIQDALGNRTAAQAFFEEAERAANHIHTQHPTDVSILVPLGAIRRALADHYRKTGDSAQAQHWRAEAQRMWREFPDQNEFVRRKAAEN